MKDFLEQFEDNGFFVFADFINQAEAQGINHEIDQLLEQSLFKKAGIGKADNFQIDTAQRGDFIHWIDTTDVAPNTRIFIEKLNELITQLNRNFYLGLRDFECHYTQYPAGTFYKRHTDRHKSGSARVVSFVLYLNSQWQTTDGGQLIIYGEGHEQHAITPSEGTLAIFLSEKEHEVLPTNRARRSITGWLLNTHK